jgi:hypothetical protein
VAALDGADDTGRRLNRTRSNVLIAMFNVDKPPRRARARV